MRSKSVVLTSVAIALTLGFLPLAQAGVLKQVGKARTVVSLGTYGMKVKGSIVLKSLVPSGWNLVQRPDAPVPAEISWRPTDTWVGILGKIAASNKVEILIDWTHRVVNIYPERLPARIGSAGSAMPTVKPVPRRPLLAHTYKAPVLKSSAPRKPKHSLKSPHAAIAPASAESGRALGSPAPEAVVHVTYSITLPPQPSAGPARSFYAQSARQVLEVLARHYGLRLEWHGDNFRLPGPVTLLFDGHLREDVLLLQTALGPYAPLDVTYYARSRELVVRHALYPQYFAFVSRPVPPAKPRGLWYRFVSLFGRSHKEPSASGTELAAVEPVRVKNPASPPDVGVAELAHSPATPAAGPMVAAVPTEHAPITLAPEQTFHEQVPATTLPSRPAAACPQLSLRITKGSRLSTLLSAFLNAQHISLKWEVPYDLRAQADGVINGKTAESVAQQLLSAVGLAYRVNKNASVLIVMPAPAGAASAHVN